MAPKHPLKVRIVGRDLPGTRFCGDVVRDPVHVGIQRDRDVIDTVRGDANEAVFDFTIDLVDGDDVDFRGPYVHGKRGERFVYLSWGVPDGDGGFEMFRRLKLQLSPLDPNDVRAAAADAKTLEARLPLTDGRGGPLCASVRPPTVAWHVV